MSSIKGEMQGSKKEGRDNGKEKCGREKEGRKEGGEK